jgi:hypothetical protein
VRNITALESVKATSVGVVQAQYYAIFHNRANLFIFFMPILLTACALSK